MAYCLMMMKEENERKGIMDTIPPRKMTGTSSHEPNQIINGPPYPNLNPYYSYILISLHIKSLSLEGSKHIY